MLHPQSSILHPQSATRPPATVIILSAEDNPEDTIVPRLKAAGADLDRVIIVGGFADDDEPEFPRDLPALRRLIQETGARMVIIDPLIAYLGKDANAHNDQSSRRVLKALDKLAQQTGVAILAIRHLNKQAGQAALYRGGGSIAFIGAARTGLLVAKDPEHAKECLLAVNKVNVGARAPTLRYTLTPTAGSIKVDWLGESAQDADKLLRPPGREAPALREACRFLETLLADGPVPAAEVMKHVNEIGMSKNTLQRAKLHLGIESEFSSAGKNRGGTWAWALPNAQG